MLDYVERTPHLFDPIPRSPEIFAGSASLLLLVVGMSIRVGILFPIAWIMLLVSMILYFSRIIGESNKARKEPVLLARVQAAKAAHRMRALLKLKRLHRVVGKDALEMLDVAASEWLRARRALHGVYWRNAITGQSASTHSNIVYALDNTADELVGYFRHSIENDPGNPDLREMLQEMAGRYRLSGASTSGFHPAFDDVRETMHKLAKLADQLEDMNRNSPIVADIQNPNSRKMLERSMEDLKEIQKAENELRDQI